MSLRKDFPSLRKSRPSGVVPRNLLNHPVHKISVPTIDTINSGASYITDPLNVEEKIRSADIKTCFFTSILIQESGLAAEPFFTIGIQGVNHNGSEIRAHNSDLILSLSANTEYLYFMKSSVYINKLVVPRMSIKFLYFSDDKLSVLFILQKNFGYIFARFSKEDTLLCDFLTKNTNHWIESAPVVLESGRIEERLRDEIEKRENSHMSSEKIITYKMEPEKVDSSPQKPINISSELPSKVIADPLSKLPKIASPNSRPSSHIPRQTRSYSKASTERVIYDEVDDDDADEDFEVLKDSDSEPIIREAPANFDPPLKYSLHNGKKFIISYNDFKTLYNNDWINDTLIDFFIAYDMDHAVHELKAVNENDIYAFNSFFFTKVFSRTEGQESPSYYENVRRWLMKIDLMSYNSVIIPINENLHWYCAVIKNLPRLLAHAKSQRLESSQESFEEPKKKKALVDVNIIDSLRQPHTNITAPLKRVIKEYCLEKHGVEISTELIRFNSVGVPRQRNFNDCGIHVIYNIQKWLSEPDTCEAIWRKHSKSAMRSYFKSSERSDMRQKLITILLDLHSKQDHEQRSDKANEEAQSEDDIEEISYLSSKPANEEPHRIEEKGTEGETKDLAHLPNEPEISKEPEVLKETEPSRESEPSKEAGIVPSDSWVSREPENVSMYSSVSREPETLEKLELLKEPEISKKLNFLKEPELSKVSNEPDHFSMESQMILKEQNITLESTEKMKSLPADERNSSNPGSIKNSEEESGTSDEVEITTKPVKSFTTILQEVGKPHKRTLDPRILEREENVLLRKEEPVNSLGLMVVEHPQIRKLCNKLHPKAHTITFLNKMFPNHNKHYDELKQKYIQGLTKKYDDSNTLRELKAVEASFEELLQEPAAPMDEPFVIQESEDSGGELNRSVGDLKISEDEMGTTGQRKYTLSNTPEATRVFMKQAEESSPSKLSKSLHTRGTSPDTFDDSLSDIEILEDDVEILSEVSGAGIRTQSKARDLREKNRLASQEKRALGSQGKGLSSQEKSSISHQKSYSSPAQKNHREIEDDAVVTIEEENSDTPREINWDFELSKSSKRRRLGHSTVLKEFYPY